MSKTKVTFEFPEGDFSQFREKIPRKGDVIVNPENENRYEVQNVERELIVSSHENERVFVSFDTNLK